MNLEKATVLALQYKLKEEYIPRRPAYTDMYMICMNIYSGKRMYLTQADPYVKHWYESKHFEWSFDKNEGMKFKDKEEAEKFAKKWFKNFNGWYIYTTSEFLGSM